jgi:hypothetical protein
MTGAVWARPCRRLDKMIEQRLLRADGFSPCLQIIAQRIDLLSIGIVDRDCGFHLFYVLVDG